MPASGVRPEAIAKAIASGRATSPTVRPAARSAANAAGEYCRSASTDAGGQREWLIEMSFRGERPDLTTALYNNQAHDPGGYPAERLRQRLVPDGRLARRDPLVFPGSARGHTARHLSRPLPAGPHAAQAALRH